MEKCETLGGDFLLTLGIYFFPKGPPYETVTLPGPAGKVQTARGQVLVRPGQSSRLIVCPPGKITSGWTSIVSEDRWTAFCGEYGENSISWPDGLVEGTALRQALGALAAARPLPVEAADSARVALEGASILPGRSFPDKKGKVHCGWLYSCPDLRAAVWIEVWSLAVARLRVKLCRRCGTFFIPWPPQTALCSRCQPDYTWQTAYRQHKQDEKERAYASAKNVHVRRSSR